MRIETSLIELALCVSEAADLVDRSVADHHRRVAFISDRLADEMGLRQDSRDRLVLAAALHDIGALTLRERLRALEFDIRETDHAEPGYLLLREFEPFSDIAPIVRVHHVEWARTEAIESTGIAVPDEAHLLFLADRVSVLFDAVAEPLGQRAAIVAAIRNGAQSRFMPEAVAAFVRIAKRESFWFDMAALQLHPSFAPAVLPASRPVSVDVDSLATMLARIVDFRSRYTAAHSSGVAAAAETVAALMGLPPEDRAAMRAAGLLHDLGKLAVPAEVLEKPSRLTPRERSVVQAHAFYTKRILSHVPGLAAIADAAAHHHERIDGTGYPDHLKSTRLSRGARLVAASDVFAALSEDRPYRPAMELGEVLSRLTHMAKRKRLDRDIVAAVVDGADRVETARCETAEDCRRRYRKVARSARLT